MNFKKIAIVVMLVAVLVLCAGFLYRIYFWSGQKNPEHQVKVEPQVDLNIKAGDIVSSPLNVSGTIGGPWFFEGNLPLRIEDDEQRVISNGHAQAQGEWMTTDQVAFTGTIEFKVLRDMDGFVVIAKDNPSGLPENEAAIRIPVHIKASTSTAQTLTQ